MNRARVLQLFKSSECAGLGSLLFFSGLINALSAGGSMLAAAWQEAATPQPPAQQAINYRQPVREYKDVRMGDMKVSVERPLQAEAPQFAAKALERLKAERTRILAALPSKASKQLRTIPFFLMYGPKAKGGGRSNGLEYFQKDAPQGHPELDRRWGDAIVIYCAQNYAQISDLWARKALLHEFAHAYHLEQWSEHQPDIQSAWEHARDSGLYRNVLDVETEKRLETGYALVNQLEYFAELSCMYFAKCNYQPSARGDLKAYDPVGYAMIRKLWRPEK
jgi:hypothetical protein